jgi:ActR/RegA family two-component response regulator
MRQKQMGRNKQISRKKWEKIEKELNEAGRNISAISRKYAISRRAIYFHAWKKGLIQKKQKKGILSWFKAKITS